MDCITIGYSAQGAKTIYLYISTYCVSWVVHFIKGIICVLFIGLLHFAPSEKATHQFYTQSIWNSIWKSKKSKEIFVCVNDYTVWAGLCSIRTKRMSSWQRLRELKAPSAVWRGREKASSPSVSPYPTSTRELLLASRTIHTQALSIQVFCQRPALSSLW